MRGRKRCVFSGGPATHKINRANMPMLTGKDVLNFFPAATGGLLIAGPYLAALQSLPLGGRRSEGKLLIAQSDDPALTIALARNFVEDNRRIIALAQAGKLPSKEGPDESLSRELAAWDTPKKRPKYPDAKSAFTLIAHDLQVILQKTSRHLSGRSLAIYWLSNSGQGPSLEIFSVPSQLLTFLRRVGEQRYRGSWGRIVATGWDSGTRNRGESKSRRPAPPPITGAGRSRNRTLVDLFSIYSAGFLDLAIAGRFVRHHFLRTRAVEPNWDLTELFLTEILGMSPDRITRMKDFADRLAAYIQSRNDGQFFKRMIYGRKAWEVRNVLVKAQRNEAMKGGDLLFSLDDYLAVFEAEDSVGLADWSLIRDLICIRLVEQLHGSGWLTPDKLSVEEEQEQEVEAAQSGE